MIPKEPIRINKNFGFDAVEANDSAEIPYITVRGYASKMFDTAGDFVIDADSENINTMGIDLSRLKDGTLPLLYGHDQSKPVGKITTAEYKSDGLMIEATLYKLPDDQMTNFVYQSVKAGVLNSFSVGILVKDFDIIEKEGEDYLQLAKSELIETSIVAVPSNPKATFGIIDMKSVDSEKHDYKTIISKKALKEDNPNVCSQFEECVLATKAVEVEEKALNYDDTKKEGWIKSQEFHTQLSTLFATIEDNWYEKAWGELSGEEALMNVKASFDSFIADHEKLLLDDKEAEKSLKGTEEMVTKSTDETPVTPEEEVEAKPAESEVVAEETKEEIPEEEVTKTEPVKAQEEAKVEEPKEPEAPTKSEEVPEAKERTFNDLLDDVAGIKVDGLTEDELEKVYEAFSDVTEKIEAMVREEIKAEIESSPAA